MGRGCGGRRAPYRRRRRNVRLVRGSAGPPESGRFIGYKSECAAGKREREHNIRIFLVSIKKQMADLTVHAHHIGENAEFVFQHELLLRNQVKGSKLYPQGTKNCRMPAPEIRTGFL